MKPVERQDERVHSVEISKRKTYPFLLWLYPDTWRLDVNEFPAGPFLIACAIVGGLVNYSTGDWLFPVRHHDGSLALLLYTLFGIAVGIAIAIKIINWLADHSPD